HSAEARGRERQRRPHLRPPRQRRRPGPWSCRAAGTGCARQWRARAPRGPLASSRPRTHRLRKGRAGIGWLRGLPGAPAPHRAAALPQADHRYWDTEVVARTEDRTLVASARISLAVVRGAARRLARGMLAMNDPAVVARVFPAYAR